MKTLFLSIATICSLQAAAQISYVDTDWIIDQTQVMFDGQMDTLELDFDQDGTKDMRISSSSTFSFGFSIIQISAVQKF